MPTYDQAGNVISEPSSSPTDNFSLGSAIFEFFNPSAVQAEQVAVGAQPQSYADIWTTAASDAASAAAEQAQNVKASVQNVASSLGAFAKLAAVAIIVGGIAYVVSQSRGRHG